MPTTKLLNGYPFIRYSREYVSADEMITKSEQFFNRMDERRSCRAFSSKPVPGDVIKNIIKTASTAPSAAHKQPWTFCVVADAGLKKRIRIAAEKEEELSYEAG